MEAAAQLARTKDFGFEYRPWGNDITIFEVVDAYLKRVHRKEGDFSFTADVYRESAAAKAFRAGMRLVSGFSFSELEANKAAEKTEDGPFFDYTEIPSCVMREILNKVPSFFLGLLALRGPKAVRYLFFLDLPSPVMEADLCASHLKEIAELCRQRSIPCSELCDYVKDERSIKAFREQHSDHLGCKPVDVKQLVNMLGYGSSGKDWRELHGVSFTPALKAIKARCRSLCRFLELAGRSLPLLAKNFLQDCERPSLSLMSYSIQFGERLKIDAMAQILKGHSQVHGFINDSVVFHGPSVAEALSINETLLKPAGLTASIQVFPNTVDEYKAFVRGRAGVDFSFLPARMDTCVAKTEEIEYTNYIYPSSHWPKLAWPGNPVLAAARAVAPFMLYHQDRQTKKVQYFDEKKAFGCRAAVSSSFRVIPCPRFCMSGGCSPSMRALSTTRTASQ
jgi:hypothetical protein